MTIIGPCEKCRGPLSPNIDNDPACLMCGRVVVRIPPAILEAVPEHSHLQLKGDARKTRNPSYRGAPL